MTHHLKTWPLQFQAIIDRRKSYELRKDDRKFAVGDELVLHEWDPLFNSYTGRVVRCEVTYKTKGGDWGLPPELCVLSIRIVRCANETAGVAS